MYRNLCRKDEIIRKYFEDYKFWFYFDPSSKTNRLPCLFSAFNTLSLYFFLIVAKGSFFN